MITCRELTELLIDYVAGELPADKKHLLELHLSFCPPCVTYLETYEITIKLTRQLPPAALPPELVARLRAVLEKGCGEEKGEA